jgi:hypothetical protein
MGSTIPIGHGRFKQEVATPLVPGEIVSYHDYRLLRALSVSTVEELLGLVAVDPEAVAAFLPDADLLQIQADAGRSVGAEALAALDTVEATDYAMGATPPDDVEVEDRASPDYVQSWLPEEAASQEERQTGDEQGVNLLECFQDVRHQGTRGTCVAHAVCAVLECQRSRLHGVREDLSEQFLYWLAKQNDGRSDQEGTWIRLAAPLAEREGVCLEEVWAYDPQVIAGNESHDPPPPGAAEDAAARTLRAPREIGGRDVAAMIDSLDDHRPVAFSVPVYDSWYLNRTTRLNGLIAMPLPNSALRGGHAMCLVGYGLAPDFAGGGYFIVRNSWGTHWARRSPAGPGHGALPFLYVEKYGWEAWTAD